MKTDKITGAFNAARSLSLPLWQRLLATVGVMVLSAFSNVQAQVTVQTLGGGPHSLPISMANSAGDQTGNTLNNSQFNEPYGIVVDNQGSLFLADRLNNKLAKITFPGDKVKSVTFKTSASFNQPVALALDKSDFMYILTMGDGTIVKADIHANIDQIIFVDLLTSSLSSPTALAVDVNTNIYVTELNGAVKRLAINPLNPTNWITTTISPVGTFNSPRGISVIDTNNLAISDTGNHSIKKLTVTNGAISLLAGNGTAGYQDGLAVESKFNTPYQIATAPNGNIIVADRLNHRVRFVSPLGSVGTVYGVSSNAWVDSPNSNPALLAGWVDGTSAAARDPVGVTVAPSGNAVYVSELGYHLVRQATGVSFGAITNGGGTNVVGIVNSNLVSNIITLGFQSGEGSSDYIAAAGQIFYCPVTLSLMPNQRIESLGFTIGVTNGTGPAVGVGQFGFQSMLERPAPEYGPGLFAYIPPQFLITRVTNVTSDFNGVFTTNIINVFTNATFTTFSNNLLSVAWLETHLQTNLYDTGSQDLVTYSQPHITQFNKPNVVVGGYAFQVPTTAPIGSTYRVQVFNASGAHTFNQGVTITAPTNGSLTNGFINSIKQITVGSRPYLVGDVSNFRWFNAGEFGDQTLSVDDASQTFQTAIYRLFYPPPGSDYFDAMDSSNGSINPPLNASSGDIDGVVYGDGQINVDDVFVTLRRALNPYAKWYARYWSNGVKYAVEVTNTLAKPDFGFNHPATTLSLNTTPAPADANVTFMAGDAVANANTISIPISVKVEGAYPIRVMLLGMKVVALDGSPNLTDPVRFSFLQESKLGKPFATNTIGNTGFGALWLNESVTGLSAGTYLLGNLIVTLPANAPADSAYSVEFANPSASPNGLGLIPRKLQKGLITLVNRLASSRNDGISDAWRLKYFGTIHEVFSGLGNVDITSAMADADGDGIPNWAECKAGTDPADAESMLKLASKRTADAPGVSFSIPTIIGKTYVVEACDTLTGVWEAVSGNISGTGSNLDFQDSNPAGGLRFYRVRLVEP